MRLLFLSLISGLLAAGCSGGSSSDNANNISPSATPSTAPITSSGPPGIPDTRSATITNTGSTNTLPYAETIALNSDGSVLPAGLPASVVVKLFADLDAAGPVANLPLEPCAKSASFGSETYIRYNGSKSPDLQCAGSSTAGSTLNQDVSAIVQALGLGGRRSATQ